MADSAPAAGSAVPESAAPALDGTRQLTTLLLVSVGCLLVSLTQSLLLPILPALGTDLRAPETSVEWLLTATLLTGAVAVPVLGRMGDLFGKKKLLVAAVVALTVGSLVCAVTSNLGVLIVGRAITGISLAAIPLGISLISTVLPAHRAATGIALISAMLGIGGALGLPLAGLVAEHADYHVLFWICVAGGAVSLAGIAVAVPEPPRVARGRLDLPGTVLLSAGLVALLLPLAQAAAWGWADPRTIGLLVGSAVLLTVFVLVERRLKSPLVDVISNARPALLLTNVASMCVGFALFASLIGTTSYVQAPAASGYGFGSSILVSGLCLLPSGLAMLALSPVSAALSQRYGPRVTLALGAAVVAAGFVMRIALTGRLWEIVVGTTVAGAGTGIAYAAMPGLILRAAPASELAAANGLNSLARAAGSSLASAIGGTLLASATVTLAGTVLPSLGAYRILFAACAGAAVLGALIALVIPAPATGAASGSRGRQAAPLGAENPA